MPKPDNDAQLFDIMYTTRAMRRLEPDPVPEELLVQLIDAAIQGPSGTNSQNWRFVIVRDREQVAKMAKAWRVVTGFYAETLASAPLRPGETTAGRERNRKAGQYMIDHMEETPAFVFACTRRDAELAAIVSAPSTMLAAVRHFGPLGALRLAMNGTHSAAMQATGAAYPAVQNLLLAARALGLGAVLTTPHLFVPGEFEAIVNLPDDFTLSAVIPVGYPKGKFGPMKRPDPRTVISWDRC